jgi:hypothetical protein
VTGGEGALPPSWEQLVTGGHPSFRGASAAAGCRGPARHGRDGWRVDGGLVDAVDVAGGPANDGMGWGEAVVWTVVAAGAATMVASRLGGFLH